MEPGYGISPLLVEAFEQQIQFVWCMIYRYYHVRYDMTNSHHMLLYCYTDSYFEAYKLPIFLVECYYWKLYFDFRHRFVFQEVNSWVRPKQTSSPSPPSWRGTRGDELGGFLKPLRGDWVPAKPWAFSMHPEASPGEKGWEWILGQLDKNHIWELQGVKLLDVFFLFAFQDARCPCF